MNECGDCTACCTLFPIAPIGKPVNTHCPHCDGGGCSIYDDKPQTCTDFICAYLQGKNLPKELRPDKCGVIFIKHTENIFSGALIHGAKITDIAKGQAMAFNKQGYSVIMLSVDEKHPYVMLADKHEIGSIMKEYKEAMSGNL